MPVVRVRYCPKVISEVVLSRVLDSIAEIVVTKLNTVSKKMFTTNGVAIRVEEADKRDQNNCALEITIQTFVTNFTFPPNREMFESIARDLINEIREVNGLSRNVTVGVEILLSWGAFAFD